MSRRRRLELALNVAVGLMTVLALYFLVRERVAPWIAERSVVDPGEALQQSPSLVDAETGDSILFRAGEATLLLVFRSTCPTCRQFSPSLNR